MEFELVKRVQTLEPRNSPAARHSTSNDRIREYMTYIRHLYSRQPTMSAYFDMPVEICSVVCTKCGTATFRWLAEVFSCNVCGAKFNLADGEEAYPDISMEDSSDAADNAGWEQEGKEVN
jgi:hypothetical protein